VSWPKRTTPTAVIAIYKIIVATQFGKAKAMDSINEASLVSARKSIYRTAGYTVVKDALSKFLTTKEAADDVFNHHEKWFKLNKV
jgi:hypothetical protein